MGDDSRILALVGSYRKGGIIDTAIDEILASAAEQGAQTEKIYLIDKHIEFCTNCRTCTQQKGLGPGTCVIVDEMACILEQIERSDGIVIASPMNFGTVTAVMKRFIERLVCFAYWPWGMNAPKVRNMQKNKRAVVVASSAAPSPLARLSSKQVKLLKDASGLLGASTIGVLFIGLAAKQREQDIGRLAREIAAHFRGVLSRSLDVLEHRLSDGRQFVAGDRPTIADCTLQAAFQFARFRKVDIDPAFANVMRWDRAYRDRPSARSVLSL